MFLTSYNNNILFTSINMYHIFIFITSNHRTDQWQSLLVTTIIPKCNRNMRKVSKWFKLNFSYQFYQRCFSFLTKIYVIIILVFLILCDILSTCDTYVCAISWAIMKALVSPSSLFSVQLRFGSQTPATGAYPDGPPMSARVSHTAISWTASPGERDACRRLFQAFTFCSDLFASPNRITESLLDSKKYNLVMTSCRFASREGSW